METLNIENDAVKSVRVKSGYHVKLYKHAYFTGRLATVGPGDYPLPSLCSKGFESDELSSLIVEREDGKLISFFTLKLDNIYIIAITGLFIINILNQIQ